MEKEIEIEKKNANQSLPFRHAKPGNKGGHYQSWRFTWVLASQFRVLTAKSTPMVSL